MNALLTDWTAHRIVHLERMLIKLVAEHANMRECERRAHLADAINDLRTVIDNLKTSQLT